MEAFALPAHALAPAQNHVDREPVQPGPEGRLAAERVQLFPRPYEDILGHVVRVGRVQHAPHQTMDPRDVAAVQAFEGASIAAVVASLIGACTPLVPVRRSRAWIAIEGPKVAV